MLYPTFFARNRILIRVVAKQAKTTIVKNNFINGKKNFKGILSGLLDGMQKVQFRRKNLGEKIQAKSSICFRTSSSLSVLLRTRPAHRLSSQHFAAVSTPNIAELVPSGFCGGPNAFCQEKHQHFHVDRQLVTEKEISS